MNCFILIKMSHDDCGIPIAEDNIAVFSTFEKAYTQYMSEPREDGFGQQITYYIEEWNIDGERINSHRYTT